MLNKKFLGLLFCLIASAILNLTYGQTAISNSFTLTTKATTSAGVYKTDGTLVRTLWSGVSMAAGTYPIKWDGTDDFLQPLPVDNYTVKVISNNVQYQWQGVIGNKSLNKVGPTIHRSLDPATNIVIVGANAYYTVGYDEGTASHFEFALNNPQVKVDPFAGIGNQTTDFTCTDGTNIYWTGWDNYQDAYSWVYATKVSDNSIVNFSSGAPYKVRYGKDFSSVIDLKTTQAKPSGIAVSGTYLFVSYKSLGTVDVLNKTTGALVRTLTMNAPSRMAVDGSSIWVTTGTNTLQKYPINSDGSLGTPSLSISGLSSPADVRVNGTMLAVVDGGTNNQIKTFNTGTAASIWTLGQPGGISSSPLITNDRFGFWKIKEETGLKESYGGIAFASDGSFWVCDPSNRRLQHFDANRNFIESIIYQGKTYSCFVDPNNHARVIGNLMEFQVDYSTVDIRNAWTPKYNWEGNFSTVYILQDGIKDITTLSNGRTYGLVRKRSNNDYEFVELNPTTGLRSTGVIINNGVALKLYPDGTLYNFRGYGLNETAYWEKKTLNGFDASNNPIYPASFSVVLSNSATDMQQPRLSGSHLLPWEVTSSNVLVNFRGNREQPTEKDAYHLGGLNPTTGKWLWKTSIGTHADYQGDFPADGAFDIGNGPPAYAGSVAMAIERNIIWGFNGEGWKQSQTNKWNHYYDNGLFIGQFGFTGPEYNIDQYANAAFAGNAFSPSVVKEGDDYYLYHNDESVHGGLLRWKITGLNSIQEQTIPLTTSFARSGEVSLPGTDLMYGLPYDTVLTNSSPTWKRATAESFDWSVKTNVKTYSKRNSPDLYARYSIATAGTNTINRDLGVNSNLFSWQLTGKITYDGCMPNFPDMNGLNQFLDVLDNNGKIITRFYQTVNFGTNPATTTIYANNSIIASGNSDISATTIKLQNLNISKSGTAITVTYAGYAPVILNSSYDGTANMSNPTTMRLYFTNNGAGNVYPKTTGISDFRFVNTSATPDAPTLTADDVTNTLSATSVLGTSEILVSENGGAFVAYTGQINVGNVARSAGYWKFKIKASTLRNESAIVNSPEFTAITTPDAPTLAVDDVANTLSASSVLGTSEILVSENNGAFVAYAGQISVGNVARAAGYWKFKIKASTLRNESAVVNSAEFTVTAQQNVTPEAPVVFLDDVANTIYASHPLGDSEILVNGNNTFWVPYTGVISVGNVNQPAGYWQFKVRAAAGRNESAVASSSAFTEVTTPDAPTLVGDDAANTLNASSALGASEIVVSENGGAFVAYAGQINVGNVARAAGYWKFKIKASASRNESAVVNSPEFTAIFTTPDAPTLTADDVTNTLSATSVLGTSEILVSENGGAFVAYTGQINVGNVARSAGYWKFKIKASTLRNESAIVNSPEFTAITTPDAPTLAVDDVANTLSASSVLGASEILVSENGGAFVAYAGQISVGNVARAAGYWKFKIKASTLRNESAVVNSAEFTVTAQQNVTPEAPVVFLDDVANTIYASHPLGDSEILVNGNNTFWVPYTGVISVGNVNQPAGYWQFKVRAAAGRNESAVASSSAFTEVTTPDAPTLVGDDAANTLNASSALGASEIVVSENGGAFVAYAGQINVGNVARAAGYWKFKIKASASRNESAVVNSPEFTAIFTTPDAPTLTADDVTNTLSATSVLGTSEILVSENGGAFVAYAGQISVGNIARAAGYWKFKIKASTLRNESAVINSPEFTAISTTPDAPTLTANDVTNTLTASSVLGTSEILVSENGGAFVAYAGQINVGKFSRAAGYWRFKIKAAPQRNESAVAYSPAFNKKASTADVNLQVNTSNINLASVSAQENQPINVFPNPIISTNIFIQSNNLEEGEYSVMLVNSMGQIIFKASINHTGGALRYSIPVSQSLAKGMYSLQLAGKSLKFSKQLLK